MSNRVHTTLCAIMVASAAAASIMACGYVAKFYQPAFELQATTASGDLFIAGSGDSCDAARVGAVMPERVATVDCVRVR